MEQAPNASTQMTTLHHYAAGLLGTHQAIEQAGLDDYADLMMAMTRHDLRLPKPLNTPQRQANLARAREILQPLLRHGY
ncbi:MAG: hypothetical protein H7833_07720 [Magnetococcus sp. DMHC-1]|nr:hypothetical protein [Magnetococcales bacterium]